MVKGVGVAGLIGSIRPEIEPTLRQRAGEVVAAPAVTAARPVATQPCAVFQAALQRDHLPVDGVDHLPDARAAVERRAHAGRAEAQLAAGEGLGVHDLASDAVSHGRGLHDGGAGEALRGKPGEATQIIERRGLAADDADEV